MEKVVVQITENELLIYFEGLSWQEALSLFNDEPVTVTQLSYNVNNKEFYYLDVLGDENGEGPQEVPHFVQEPISIGALLRQLHNVDLYLIMLDNEEFELIQFPRLGFLVIYPDYTSMDKHIAVLEKLLGSESAPTIMEQAATNGIAYTEGLKEISGKEFTPFISDRFHRFQDEQNRIWYEEQIKKEV